MGPREISRYCLLAPIHFRIGLRKSAFPVLAVFAVVRPVKLLVIKFHLICDERARTSELA